MNFERLIDQIFQQREPIQPQLALRRLKQNGGIDNLLLHLSRQDSDTKSPLRPKSYYLLQSFLLYTVTLSLCSKLLLFKQNIISNLSIIRECIGILLLSCVILIKYKSFRQQQQSSIASLIQNPNRITVSPSGAYTTINDREIKPGEIILVQQNQVINIDGIVLRIVRASQMYEEKGSCIVVNERNSRNKNSQCLKYSVQEAMQGDGRNCFVYHDSIVAEGAAEIVVCRVYKIGQQKHQQSQLEEGITYLQTINNAVRIVKSLIIVPILILGVQWLSSTQHQQYQGFIYFLTMLANLLLYLSYVNKELCLQILGKCFFQSQDGQSYTLSSLKALQKLAKTDIIILSQPQYAGKIQAISLLSRFHDIKIITDKSRHQIQKGFAQQLNSHAIYQQDESTNMRERIELLLGARFISTTQQHFKKYYITLLVQMGYSLVIITDKYEEQTSVLDIIQGNIRQEYARSKPGSRVMDMLIELEVKGAIMSKVKDCYFSIIINSCLELLMLTYWACRGCIVELHLNILTLCVNREESKILMKEWKDYREGWGLRRQNWIYYNFYLLLYYAFMMGQIHSSSSRPFLLFLTLIANRLFRCEALFPTLNKKQFIIKWIGLLALILGEIAMDFYRDHDQKLKGSYVSILMFPIIILLYRFYIGKEIVDTSSKNL